MENGNKGRADRGNSKAPRKGRHALVEDILGKHGVVLTLGAEPTCVPLEPLGPEWSVSATGPTKLIHARNLARALVEQSMPGALTVFAPGKTYPGEVNPRWALNLLARRDGGALITRRETGRTASPRDARAFLRRLATRLRIKTTPIELPDPSHPGSLAHIIPIDGDGRVWNSPVWKFPVGTALIQAEGPAGLRLPLQVLVTDGARRALTVEVLNGRLDIFLPPLLQEPWIALLEAVDASLPQGIDCDFSGHVPEDFLSVWHSVVIAADPGVLEINLPPCVTWEEYDNWLLRLDAAQDTVGLRTWKAGVARSSEGTGGGHHLVFGGPSVERNPFFTRPDWLVSILRFWQRHPSLAYLFTGCYVGPSSQAPRPDESGKSLWDLEMAYAWLEQLPRGEDHRMAIAETLLHLHSDTSGNTHRAEISFDKFWNTLFPGGSRGLVEFRAIESLPRREWASAVARLWISLAAHLLAKPFRSPLHDFGDTLHDRFFLPTVLWADFEEVLAHLGRGGFAMDVDIFRAIRDWRFPLLLETPDGIRVRRGLEGWPLLCETPIEGGSTSRFVDTSMDRLEFSAPAKIADQHVLRINGRELPLCEWRDGIRLSGLRCRRSARHPSLHPGMPVQFPLILEIEGPAGTRAFILRADAVGFTKLPRKEPVPPRGATCRRANAGHLSFDLRLPG